MQCMWFKSLKHGLISCPSYILGKKIKANIPIKVRLIMCYKLSYRILLKLKRMWKKMYLILHLQYSRGKVYIYRSSRGKVFNFLINSFKDRSWTFHTGYTDPAQPGRRYRHLNNYSKKRCRNMAARLCIWAWWKHEEWLKVTTSNTITSNTLTPYQVSGTVL